VRVHALRSLEVSVCEVGEVVRRVIVYLTLPRPVAGSLELRLALPREAVVTGVSPAPLTARPYTWLVETYPRRFSWGTVHSFGVRVDCEFRLRRRLVERCRLSVARAGRARAIEFELKSSALLRYTLSLGPLPPGCELEVERGRGRVLELGEAGAAVAVVESSGGEVRGRVAAPHWSGVVSAQLTADGVPEEELPFEVSIIGPRGEPLDVHYTNRLVAGLPDLTL